MNKIIEINQGKNTGSDTSLGIYTYCLTRSPISFPHTFMGIDGVHEVYLAEQDGIFAILSNVSLKEFNEETIEKNMTDVIWLAHKAKRHEEVIDFVMTYAATNHNRITPVVPLRFCTIYKNQESLFKAVLPYKEKIMGFLDYTADKTECSVKVFCDKMAFLNSYDKNEEPSATINQAPLLPGEAYLLARKMSKGREETFTVDIQRILSDVHCALSPYADCHKFLRCTNKNIHGRSFDMVMNTAFLVRQQAFILFRDTIGVLSEKYKEQGLVFEFSGPWPPYSFCPELP